MILAVAYAPVDDPGAQYIYGAWSDIVVGDQPTGLVDCYLSRGNGTLQMVSIWHSLEDHNRAIEETQNHPAFGFFEACGLDHQQSIYQVVGRLTP